MIYLVEDDESIRELVVYTLKSQDMDAKGFEKPSLFWKEMEKELPALILLDIMLPEEDGLSILKKLRARPDTRKLPVIMLTARGSEYDTVMGLDSGADDYIPKPFRMMELISRCALWPTSSTGVPSAWLNLGAEDLNVSPHACFSSTITQ